jgi:hypothetical protein
LTLKASTISSPDPNALTKVIIFPFFFCHLAQVHEKQERPKDTGITGFPSPTPASTFRYIYESWAFGQK